MIGLTNNDSSFFKVDCPVSNSVLTEDVLSLTIAEELGNMVSGSIQLIDNNDIYTKMLYPGQKLKIRWGYKRIDDPLMALFARLSNPTEVTGLMEREGLTAYVQNPSGTGDDKGNVLFNCGFIGAEIASGGDQKVYGFPYTRGQIILEVMDRMNVLTPYVFFNRMFEVLDQSTAVMQIESNFKFLLRCAREWGAIFAMGQSNGEKIALFADWNSSATELFHNAVCKSLGTSALLEYKWGQANVKSYTWKNNAGQVAGGANVQIMMVNGQVVFKTFQAATQQVVTYKIDSDKIFREMKARPSLSSQYELLQNWLAVSVDAYGFQNLLNNGYFRKVIETTAPQGYGYELSVKLMGNPLITSPMRVMFGKGFPSFCNQVSPLTGQPVTNFWVRSATHTIDRSGYNLDLDIVDALSAFGFVS